MSILLDSFFWLLVVPMTPFWFCSEFWWFRISSDATCLWAMFDFFHGHIHQDSGTPVFKTRGRILLIFCYQMEVNWSTNQMGGLFWQSFTLFGCWTHMFQTMVGKRRITDSQDGELGMHVCLSLWSAHIRSPWSGVGTSMLGESLYAILKNDQIHIFCLLFDRVCYWAIVYLLSENWSPNILVLFAAMRILM